jgi:hypothetical protein
MAVAVAVALASAAGAQTSTVPPQPGGVTRTVSATPEKALAVAESVLKSRDWEVDESDRAVGWLLTKSRGVDFKDFGVYGKGVRHRLRVTVRGAGDGRSAVTVEREVYTEERILWMTERKPVPATDQTVETGLLDAIERSL